MHLESPAHQHIIFQLRFTFKLYCMPRVIYTNDIECNDQRQEPNPRSCCVSIVHPYISLLLRVSFSSQESWKHDTLPVVRSLDQRKNKVKTNCTSRKMKQCIIFASGVQQGYTLTYVEMPSDCHSASRCTNWSAKLPERHRVPQMEPNSFYSYTDIILRYRFHSCTGNRQPTWMTCYGFNRLAWHNLVFLLPSGVLITWFLSPIFPKQCRGHKMMHSDQMLAVALNHCIISQQIIWMPATGQYSMQQQWKYIKFKFWSEHKVTLIIRQHPPHPPFSRLF